MEAVHTCGVPTNEMHQHKCDACETVWGHSSASRKCDACHTCPTCGRKQFSHHNSKNPITSKELAELDNLIKVIFG